MPRRPNTRPTHIYWLVDMRPETIAAGWPVGKPFYCGKTIATPEERLRCHRKAATTQPNRAVSKRLHEVGEYVRIQIMEIVPPEGDWVAREKFWIYTLRTLYSGAVNTTEGGQGAPGRIHTPQSRAKISDAAKARSAEISAARKADWTSPEYRARMIAANTGRKQTTDCRAKISSANKGKKKTAEQRAHLSTISKGKKQSPEHVEKRAAANRGKKRSLEFIEKIAAKNRGKKRSPEHKAKISAALTGRKMAPGVGEKRWATRRAKAEASANA